MDTVALAKVARHGQVTLPASIRRAAHVDEGDYLEVRVSGESIVLTPKKLVDKSQAYFWSPAWQEAEREASEDIGAGRVHEADTVADLISGLESARKNR
ncbi:MAG: AbrB/MazE/SpoVT family DNA-binding domain-containing protein [Thermodesulfobacteriota bacterium]